MLKPGRYVEKLDTDAPLPPSASGNYKFRVKGKSLPPQSTIKRTSLTDDSIKTFQCKYCLFTSNWSKDITRHQREIHPNYPPHILQKELSHEDNEINNNDQYYEEDEGISALLIDPVRAFGEVIDGNEDEDEQEEEEEEDEMMTENGIDDDEEEA